MADVGSTVDAARWIGGCGQPDSELRLLTPDLVAASNGYSTLPPGLLLARFLPTELLIRVGLC